LAKHLYWPARHLAYERHHSYIQCQFGNRGDILEHQELLTATPHFSDHHAQARARAISDKSGGSSETAD
jgi:hypothetical protein